MAQDNTNYIWKDRKHHLWFPWSFTVYYIEDDRLMIRTGLLNTSLEETLLYRIVDISCRQTLAGKIFGTGNIVIHTKVDATAEIILQNIKNPMGTVRLLSQTVEASRQSRNVVGKEFYGGRPMVDLDGDGIPDYEQRPD